MRVCGASSTANAVGSVCGSSCSPKKSVNSLTASRSYREEGSVGGSSCVFKKSSQSKGDSAQAFGKGGSDDGLSYRMGGEAPIALKSYDKDISGGSRSDFKEDDGRACGASNAFDIGGSDHGLSYYPKKDAEMPNASRSYKKEASVGSSYTFVNDSDTERSKSSNSCCSNRKPPPEVYPSPQPTAQSSSQKNPLITLEVIIPGIRPDFITE